MEINFIDDRTVSIKASVAWNALRPPRPLREILHKGHFLEDFQKQHPAYKIDSVTGPDSICNFRSEEDAAGEWTLTISKVDGSVSTSAVSSHKKASTKKKSSKEKTTTSGA